MNLSPDIMAAGIGLAAGLVSGWLLTRLAMGGRMARIRAENDALVETVASLKSANDQTRQEFSDLNERYLAAIRSLAASEAAVENERRAAAEKAEQFTQMRERMMESFQALSSRALQENNRSFLDLAKNTLSGYIESAKTDLDHRQATIRTFVQPLSDALEKYDQQIQAMERSREQAYGGLSQQVRSLAETQRALQKETGNLVRALRLPHVRGRWGEMTLRRVVEIAGMQNHCDFFEQQSADTEDSVVRPDMIVKLPGNRQIVIDAKVPITAYLDAAEADDPSENEALLDQHARQVKSHIVKLGQKSYWSRFTPTPEFVVLFMPGENFFSAALSRMPALIEEGSDKGVILATPTTLISLLKTVSYGWRQQAAAENAQKVAELGNELYSRLYAMVDHINRLGRELDRCVAAYNRTVGSLERRVLASARKFVDMGAAQNNQKILNEPEPIGNKPRQMAADDENGKADS